MRLKILILLLLLNSNLKAQTPNNGTIQGTVSRSTDVPSIFASHNPGTTQSVSFGGGQIIPASPFNLGQTGSLSIWFKLASFGKIFLSNYTEFDANTYIMAQTSTTIVLQTSAMSTGATFTVPTMSLNTWYNLVITRSAGTTHLYLNGTESSSGGIEQGLADFNIDRVGVYHTNIGSYAPFVYDGKLSELRLFNSVLSSTDISNLAVANPPVAESVLHWKMNEASDSTVIDYVGGNGDTTGTGRAPDTNWIRSGNNVYFNNGNVGIGTSVPQSKLAVNGIITATKLTVTQTGWPDFVFNKNYKLPRLEEIEKFIKLNQHLPGIPSAKEVEKNGIDLGNNQALLLQKIEELTLLLLQQNKRIKALEKQLKK